MTPTSRVVRQGACIGQPSRCRGGTCSCCSVCGQHRWSHDGRCLGCAMATGSMREQIIVKKVAEKLVLPDWLRTKPRSPKQKAQALAYAKAMNIDPKILEDVWRSKHGA